MDRASRILELQARLSAIPEPPPLFPPKKAKDMIEWATWQDNRLRRYQIEQQILQLQGQTITPHNNQH